MCVCPDLYLFAGSRCENFKIMPADFYCLTTAQFLNRKNEASLNFELEDIMNKQKQIHHSLLGNKHNQLCLHCQQALKF